MIGLNWRMPTMAILSLGMICLSGCSENDTGSTVAEIAAEDESFDTLESLLASAGLVDTLGTAGPFTVFAPTDAAFEAFEAANPGVLDSLTPEQVEAILLYHVVPASVPSSALSDGQMADTLLSGQSLVIDLDGGVFVDEAQVVTPDIEASNGIIHVIDDVLLPPNIVETAVAAGSFTTLVSLLEDTGLDATLVGSGPFTVFAPTDAAFEAFESANPGVLGSLSTQQVTTVLGYHVIADQLLSTDLGDGAMPATVEGNSVTIGVSGTVMVDDATVTMVDVRALNGVIHVIDEVLLPPSLE